MATVIRTGGQTIRISNGTSSARRAVEAADPISAAMEAGEAFARSEIACEAFGALVNRAAQMSMEGKASMWKRVKAAGSRTWEAIKAFFRKMIAYVTSFISGNVVMMKAKRLKKRIEDDEDLWNDNAKQNWDKKQIRSYSKTEKNTDDTLQKLEAGYKAEWTILASLKERDVKKLGKQSLKTSTGPKNDGWDDNMNSPLSVTNKDYWGAGSTQWTEAFKSHILERLTKYSVGQVKAMVFLKATVIPTLNKVYKLAEKYAKEAADNSKVAAFRESQRVTKRTVQFVIKQVGVELSLISAAISEPSD